MWKFKQINNSIALCFVFVMLITGLYLPVIHTEMSAGGTSRQTTFTYLSYDISTPVAQIADTLSARFRILSEQYRHTVDTRIRTQAYKHFCLYLSAALYQRIYSISLALSKADNPAIQRHAGILSYIHRQDGKKRTPYYFYK